jgi:hypothetical protein
VCYHAIEALCVIDADTGAADAARERAEADFEQSRQEGLYLGTGALMHALGVAALGAGDLDRAAHCGERLCEHQPEICDSIWQAQTILVAVALARGDSTQARIHIGTLLAAARPLKNRRAEAIANLGLARAALLDGDDRQAESIAHDALKVLTDHGWRPAVIDALDVLAEVALFRRQHQRAVRLAAAAGGQRSALGLVAFPQDRNGRSGS